MEASTPSLKRKTKNTKSPRNNNTQQEGNKEEKGSDIHNNNNNHQNKNNNNNNNNTPAKNNIIEDDSSANILLTLQSSSPRDSPRASSPSPSLSSSSPSPSPRSPSSPPSSDLGDDNINNNNNNGEGKCMLGDCALCTRGVPMLLVRSPTWASIMRVVFFCLQYDKKDREFFNLKTDIYGFIISHWNKLSLNKKRSDNWHKQIQDMLSHSKNLFESGMEKYKQNGFWRMKQNHDPWTMHKPRSYNWTKRASRSVTDNHPGSDSDFIHIFDLQTGAVVQDASDLESPRKKIRNDEEPADEQKHSLEDEIKNLREALAEMSENLTTVKEELKRKDQEIIEKALSYQKTLDQLEALKLAHVHEGIEREPTSPSPSQQSYSPRTSSPYRGHHLTPSHPSLSLSSHSLSSLSSLSSHSAHSSPRSPRDPSLHHPHSPHHHISPSFPRPLFSFEASSGSRRFSPLPFPPTSSPSSSSSPSPSPLSSSPHDSSHFQHSHYHPGHPSTHPHVSHSISIPSHPSHPLYGQYSTPTTATSSSVSPPSFPSGSPSQFDFKPIGTNSLLSLSAPLPAPSYTISLTTPEHYSHQRPPP